MSYTVPSTAALVARNQAALESRLNQTTPPADKAFNTVLATMEGMAAKALYKFAEDRILASSALTARGPDLDAIGLEYECYRAPAVACVAVASLAADDGTILGVNSIFVGDNGLQYRVQASVTAPSGAPGSGVVLSLACVEEGTAGNLSLGDTLTIQTPVAGAGRVATVSSVATIGTEAEGDEGYRIRVLDIERADGGGGNPSDHRTWAQSVPGVKRAYPLNGPYVGSGLTPTPAMRTIYVEAAESVDPDGIAPAGLLDQVRDAILTDTETGIARQILGFTGDYLYIRPIIRTPIYVKIVGLTVKTGTMAAAQSDIENALSTVLRLFSAFVQGLDPDFDRMDEVTSSVLQSEAQSVIRGYGGTIQNILFGLTVGTYLGKYPVAANEKLKLGGIVWEAVT
ncbi:MAG: baseplate J/gp47 family protein [Spirochaetes bacterium]|nr:baseplate J/gp47 family protein [Spirochaetota bacterium]